MFDIGGVEGGGGDTREGGPDKLFTTRPVFTSPSLDISIRAWSEGIQVWSLEQLERRTDSCRCGGLTLKCTVV